ncbi:MAG: hypothetical protein FIA98_00550 [Anaerolineae bacterium]|nr:hypothetical protein [Anaerolineae bacterium]
MAFPLNPGRTSLGAGKTRALPPPTKLLMICSFGGDLDRENSLGFYGQPNLPRIPTRLVSNQLAVDDEQVGKNVAQQRLQIRGAHPTTKQSQLFNEEIASQGLEYAGIVHRVCERYLRLRAHIVIKRH